MNSENIKKIVIFSTIFLGIFLLINLLYLKTVVSGTIIYRIEDQFNNNKNTTKILFMGDSHSKFGLSPEMIDESFNYASMGEAYFQTYYKLKYLLENKIINLQMVILPIDLHSFRTTDRSVYIDWSYWKKFINLRGILSYYGTGRFGEIIKAYFPVIGNGRLLLNYLVKKPQLTTLDRGQEIRLDDFSLVNDRVKTVADRIDYVFKDKQIFDSFSAEYFQKIIDLTDKYKIKLVLIKFPVVKDYYYGTHKYIENFNNYYSDINRLIGHRNNLEILDYHDLFFNDLSYFGDTDHLNKKGADYLTNKIKKDLKIQ